MLWLFCRRCAGVFKSPVIVARCPYCQSKRTLDGSTGTALTRCVRLQQCQSSALVGRACRRRDSNPQPPA